MTDQKISSISVIIPCLNEQQTLGGLLDSLQGKQGLEIIVVDGGSRDRTLEIASHYGVITLSSPAGRGMQLNAGARAASGGTLLFLHSDTVLPREFALHIHRTLDLPGTAAGAFRLRIRARGAGFRLVEWSVNFRSTALQMPYGDQALFVRRAIFDKAEGFPEQPLLEDFELVRRLKKTGRIRTAPVAVKTSARRWEKLGLIRTTLLNQAVLAAYLLNVSPEKLERLYYGKDRDT